MPKSIKTKTTLVIVESPAKCKKIEEFLGPGYKCLATYGHIRELKSLKNIDIENRFATTYTVVDSPIKKKQIEILRAAIKSADEVILALDGDREGEKISYCVAQVFKLNIEKTKRITFNEITETALKNAIKNPRKIDMNLVLAQQTRQILDLLVGFKVSPILWKMISRNKENSLSAGRCQSPALKLVYENQKEIDNATGIKVYNTNGYFTNLNLQFELNLQIENEDTMIDFLDKSSEFSHIYTCSQPTKKHSQPPEPFTTSRLQQVASNELHYSPKETMRICQLLYEGGYITYMRTDSKTYSEEFINEAKEYITRAYDFKYINHELQISKVQDEKSNEKISARKSKGSKPEAQEAHEAIRPTNISLQELPEQIDSKERRMYKLIWRNTLESCMAPAAYYSVTANISAPLNAKYAYTSELIDFPGWKIVENKFSRDNNEYQYLQTIAQNKPISYKKIYAKVTIKGSKLHYTEAKLVHLLEEKGIGRPSTFSSIIDKIQERGYVKKEDIKGKEIVCKDYELENGEIFEVETKREFGNEKGKLVIQHLGTIVMEFLDLHFNKLFNYNYTCLMEEALDKIAKGELIWYEVCDTFNREIDGLIEEIKDEKVEFRIDDTHTFIIGKYGPVIKCLENNGKPTFKAIRDDIDIDISKLKNGEYKLDELIKNVDTLDKDKELLDIDEKSIDTNETIKKKTKNNVIGIYDNLELSIRKGKFGLYASWGENSRTLKELGNRPIENISFEEVKKILDKGSPIIRVIDDAMSIRNGAKGDYLFYKTAKMKKPQFLDIKKFNEETSEDYRNCDVVILKAWIENKYSIKTK